MCAYSRFLCIWHLFSCLIPNEEGYFALCFGFLSRNTHALHIQLHADISFLSDHFEHGFLDRANFFDSFSALVFGIEMKIIDIHGVDSLTVECFDTFNLFTDASTFNYNVFDMNI